MSSEPRLLRARFTQRGRVVQSKITGLILGATLVGGAFGAPVEAATLSSPAWSGSVLAVNPGGAGTPTDVTGPGTTQQTSPDGTSATSKVQASTSPSITASASTNDNAVATALGQLIYYIEVSGPTGTVLLDFTGLGSVASTTIPGDFSSDIQLSVGGSLIAYIGSTDGVASVLGTSPGVAAGFNPNGFTISDSLSVAANSAIEVILFTEASAKEGAGSASAFLDPFFFVDPSTPNANEYSIITDGIGNSPATTPIPAALPLFATGLGALGLLGWRRKRKAAGTPAA